MSDTIRISAKPYEDYDDCLTAAATDVADARGLEGWDLDPRWEDDTREHILLDVPSWALRSADDVADADPEST